jgi:hypothetical protein
MMLDLVIAALGALPGTRISGSGLPCALPKMSSAIANKCCIVNESPREGAEFDAYKKLCQALGVQLPLTHPSLTFLHQHLLAICKKHQRTVSFRTFAFYRAV